MALCVGQQKASSMSFKESDMGSCLLGTTSDAFPIQLGVQRYLLSTCSSLVIVSGHFTLNRRHTHHTKRWPPAPPAPPIPGSPWWPSTPPIPPRMSQEAACSRCVSFSSTYIVTEPPWPPGAPCEPLPALFVRLDSYSIGWEKSSTHLPPLPPGPPAYYGQ